MCVKLPHRFLSLPLCLRIVMKNCLLTLSLVLSLSVLLAGCDKGAAEPVVVLVPQPHQALRVTLDTARSPGPFDTAQGEVLYKVETTSNRCLAWKEKFAGVPVAAEHYMKFAMKKTGPTTFEGIIFVDQIVDQDYYGLGKCHWSIDNVAVTAMLHGKLFESFLGQVPNPVPTPTYFVISDYTGSRPPIDGNSIAMSSSPVHFDKSLPDFPLTLTVSPVSAAEK
jgi:hypothetical protein